MTKQQGYSFQPDQPNFYIPVPQGQRAFLAQPVSQMTRPRWQSQVGRGRGGTQRPRHPNMQTRGERPYPGVQTRNMSHQVVRPGGPVPPQRAACKLTQNACNQYPQPQPNIPTAQPEQQQGLGVSLSSLFELN